MDSTMLLMDVDFGGMRGLLRVYVGAAAAGAEAVQNELLLGKDKSRRIASMRTDMFRICCRGWAC